MRGSVGEGGGRQGIEGGSSALQRKEEKNSYRFCTTVLVLRLFKTALHTGRSL